MVKKIIEYTVFNTYSDQIVHTMLKDLEQKKLITNAKKNQSEEIEEIVNLYGKGNGKPKDKLKIFLKINQKFNLEDYINNYEWKKAYRYCTYFKILDYNEDNLKKLKDNKNTFSFKQEKNIDLRDSIGYPFIKEEEGKVSFKFSLKKVGLGSNNEILEIKYPIMVILDLNNLVLEIRFEQLKSIFQGGDRLFYKSQINAVKGWIISMLEVKLEPIDLKADIKSIIETYNKDMDNAKIIPMKRDVSLLNGSKVVLDIDANKEFIVPILGDLKLIMKTFKRDLSNVPNLNQELINLITTVENGDVPKISLKWVKEDILIGITHEYKQEKYSFIQFYGEIKNSEVMDYVREYFTGSKQELDGEQSEDK